jgi:hypothetical protein
MPECEILPNNIIVNKAPYADTISTILVPPISEKIAIIDLEEMPSGVSRTRNRFLTETSYEIQAAFPTSFHTRDDALIRASIQWDKLFPDKSEAQISNEDYALFRVRLWHTILNHDYDIREELTVNLIQKKNSLDKDLFYFTILNNAFKLAQFIHFIRSKVTKKSIIKVEVSSDQTFLSCILSSVLDRPIYNYNGRMTQQDRQSILQSFSETVNGLLLTTEIASHGIHFPDTQWIIIFYPQIRGTEPLLLFPNEHNMEVRDLIENRVYHLIGHRNSSQNKSNILFVIAQEVLHALMAYRHGTFKWNQILVNIPNDAVSLRGSISNVITSNEQLSSLNLTKQFFEQEKGITI